MTGPVVTNTLINAAEDEMANRLSNALRDWCEPENDLGRLPYSEMGSSLLKLVREADARNGHPLPAVTSDAGGEELEWTHVCSIEEMQTFFMSRLPAIRNAARACGYAVGLHGSCRRDLDIVAVPWVAEYRPKDELAAAIQKAACGFTMSEYSWEEKPNGRCAVSFAVCWPEWKSDALSLGCIDLSVTPATSTPSAGSASEPVAWQWRKAPGLAWQLPVLDEHHARSGPGRGEVRPLYAAPPASVDAVAVVQRYLVDRGGHVVTRRDADGPLPFGISVACTIVPEDLLAVLRTASPSDKEAIAIVTKQRADWDRNTASRDHDVMLQSLAKVDAADEILAALQAAQHVEEAPRP